MGTLIKILLKISPALEAGQSLKNAEIWARFSQSSHALMVVFGFILLAANMFGFDIPLSEDQMAGLAGSVASIGGTIAMYLHTATDEKRGIKRK
jgi:hypothetical protein